ncbi:MAG: DUF1501 domain-containing protein [Acidobacteriota bacterium]
MTKKMEQTRRDFLVRTGCAALGAAAFSAGFEKFGLISARAMTAAPTDYRALVCIFLSGGNDSNNMVVPLDTTGYNSYSAARSASGLALAQGQLLSITPSSIGTPFGLHPAMPELQTLWSQQKVAVVSNVGPLVQPLTRTQYQSGAARPYQLFSHSDQVAQWQTSRADVRTQLGWGGRTADQTLSFNAGKTFPLVTSVSGAAVFGQGLATRPLSIAAAPTALNQVLVLNGFTTSTTDVARRNSMDFLRTIDRSATLVAAASDATQAAADIIASLGGTDPTLTTIFPNTGLANQLKQVAKVIKLNQTAPALGLNRQIFFCTLGGFDTHQNQISSQQALLAQLSAAMKAFYDATVELAVDSRVTTFTLSDFARTLQPSGSGVGTVGSDHGWGSHQFVLGGAVVGGDFYGVPGPGGTVFPDLTLAGPNDTDNRGRWIPTSSVDQYAATLATWFGLPGGDLPAVFPLLSRFSTPNLGFLV